MKKDPSLTNESLLVIPTGLGITKRDTLHESIVELDRKLEELGLEVKSNE